MKENHKSFSRSEHKREIKQDEINDNDNNSMIDLSIQ